VNGQTVKADSAMQLGEELPFTTIINYRNYGKVPYTYNVIAGSYLSVAAVGGNVSPQKLSALKTQVEDTKAKLESNGPSQIDGLTRENLLGDIFYSGTLGYYTQFNSIARVIGIQQKGYHYLAAGYGSFGYEPNVDYVFGVPRTIKSGGVAMDIPILRISGMDSQTPDRKKDFNMQIGLLSSTLEHITPEQIFNYDGGNNSDAISAVKALIIAAAQGQHIYHITNDNKSNVLPYINHDQNTMTEINQALSAGKVVITHANSVSVTGWSGAGYIISDPTTGDGAFKIGGGANGAFKAIGFVINIAELFYDALSSVAAVLAKKIPVLQSVANFLKVAKFTQNLLEKGLQCDSSSFSAIAFFMVLSTIGVLLLAQLVTSISNPIAAFGIGLALDQATNWLMDQTAECQ
jgi:hypothetical protein